jgi:hypothetical protein
MKRLYDLFKSVLIHSHDVQIFYQFFQETLDNLPLYYCLSRDISRRSVFSQDLLTKVEPCLCDFPCSCYPKPDNGGGPSAAAASLDRAASASGSSAATSSPAATSSLWRFVDPTYTWNYHMCRSLLEASELRVASL